MIGRYFPGLWEFYVQTALPQDQFFAATGGLGYSYPWSLPDPDSFFEATTAVFEAFMPTPGNLVDLWEGGCPATRGMVAASARVTSASTRGTASLTNCCTWPQVCVCPGRRSRLSLNQENPRVQCPRPQNPTSHKFGNSQKILRSSRSKKQFKLATICRSPSTQKTSTMRRMSTQKVSLVKSRQGINNKKAKIALIRKCC